MIPATLLALALASATAAEPAYRIAPTRYFASAEAEASERAVVLARVDAFAAASNEALATPAALLARLRADDALRRDLRRHEIALHLRAEEDTGNHAAATADAAVAAAEDRLGAALRRSLEGLGKPAADQLLAADTALAPYRFVVESGLRWPAAESANEQAVAVLAQPALQSLADAYGELRRAALRANQAASAPTDPHAAFHAKWAPYLANESPFAALLVPSVTLQEGQARLQGFASAADAAYARQGLSAAEVQGVLGAVRQSDAWQRYAAVVVAHAARMLRVEPDAVQAWQLDAAVDGRATNVAFPAALSLILGSERTLGDEIAGQFERLLDPANGRVDWCRAPSCDDAGFSVGSAGAPSALFYGAFDGSVDSMRAVAHEAAHAVHRQFMNENQPIAAYNAGPKFMFESFAIFNELVLLDHLQRTAPDGTARAAGLRHFIDDATFQVFGSARETALEETLHVDIRAGRARTAADLDARTLAVFAVYTPRAWLTDETKAFWARNKLYFVDPFYDANYLFAGLLALEYLRQFDHDPQDFERRYAALQKNGFDATPQALLQRFMKIDLDDGPALVRGATRLIVARTEELARLYASACATP